MVSMGVCVSVEDNGKEFVVCLFGGCGLLFSVKIIYILCKLDIYFGFYYKYGGIILYGCNGEIDWYIVNGIYCKSILDMLWLCEEILVSLKIYKGDGLMS